MPPAKRQLADCSAQQLYLVSGKWCERTPGLVLDGYVLSLVWYIPLQSSRFDVTGPVADALSNAGLSPGPSRTTTQSEGIPRTVAIC
jgi:hypothetical protein